MLAIIIEVPRFTTGQQRRVHETLLSCLLAQSTREALLLCLARLAAVITDIWRQRL